jgi:hypothetical protein
MSDTTDLMEQDSDFDPDDEMVESTVEVSPDTLRILGLHTRGGPSDAPVTAESRTIHLRDRELKTHSGVAVCRLTNPVLTVTQVPTPGSGIPYLIISFRYDVTTLGYRAPRGITQGMQFWNAEGGTIWSWGFPNHPQKLDCDDNRREEAIIFRWTTDVGWFPLWRRCKWTHHQWRVEPC